MTRESLISIIIATTVPLFCTDASGQTSGHHVHPPMPDQRLCVYTRVDSGEGSKAIESPLQIPSLMQEATLNQVMALPAPLPELRLTRYLPRAELRQRVESASGPDAKPAVELAVEGPTQSHRLWLVADDAEHNRLVSLIGTWRYMAVTGKEQRNELFEQFKNELTRDPSILVSRPDGSDPQELAMKTGANRALNALDCSVRIKTFYPDFSFDRQSGKPINESEVRNNPAVLVEIEHRGKKEERWVFAKFPDFKMDSGERLPLRVVLDCPIARTKATPDFLLLTIDRSTHEVWTRSEGKTTSKSLAVDDRNDVPSSQYTFRVTQFVPSGRLVEEYQPSENKGAAPAVLVEFAPASGQSTSFWLELGKERTVDLGKGPVVMWLGLAQAPLVVEPQKVGP